MKVWNVNPDVTIEMTSEEYEKWIASRIQSDPDRIVFVVGPAESSDKIALIVLLGKLVEINIRDTPSKEARA